MTEKELQPRAFSIMPLVWSMGSVLGPSFGGVLAEPAKQYPDAFGNIEFFKKYPFALPNLVLTVFFVISVLSAALFLKVGARPATRRIDIRVLTPNSGNSTDEARAERLGTPRWAKVDKSVQEATTDYAPPEFILCGWRGHCASSPEQTNPGA